MNGYEDRLARLLRLGKPFLIKGLRACCERGWDWRATCRQCGDQNDAA
jgi:hypothetical protein